MGGYYPNNVSGNNYENKYYEGENGKEYTEIS
jgi:hypothetical protein